MNNYFTGTILIIDDDQDDLIAFKDALQTLRIQNKLLLFESADLALAYLKQTDDRIFFILCDINMPRMNGYELKEAITADPHLSVRAIPFMFTSTSANFFTLKKAYASSIQGFFKKPNSARGFEIIIVAILQYWSVSIPPIQD